MALHYRGYSHLINSLVLAAIASNLEGGYAEIRGATPDRSEQNEVNYLRSPAGVWKAHPD
jgi:hypothetical protein